MSRAVVDEEVLAAVIELSTPERGASISLVTWRLANGDAVTSAFQSGVRDALRRHLLGPPVVRAVELDDAAVQALGDRRPARNLEGAGGDHHLLRRVGPVLELDQVVAVGPPDGRSTGLFCRADQGLGRVLIVLVRMT
jgi:hypothetical protein